MVHLNERWQVAVAPRRFAMSTDPSACPSITTMTVAPWDDVVVEAHGFGPASTYIEHCWLPVLGPTATWLYRRLAIPLLTQSDYEVDLVDLAVSLGLGE